MIFKWRWGKKNTNDGGEKKVKKKIYKPKKLKKRRACLLENCPENDGNGV